MDDDLFGPVLEKPLEIPSDLERIPLSKLRRVVAFHKPGSGWELSAWCGETVRIWARFPGGPLPPIDRMEGAMLAAYRPTGKEAPEALVECLCLVSGR